LCGHDTQLGRTGEAVEFDVLQFVDSKGGGFEDGCIADVLWSSADATFGILCAPGIIEDLRDLLSGLKSGHSAR
jgi:hypothetical protein